MRFRSLVSFDILPLKLAWLAVERSSFVVNCFTGSNYNTPVFSLYARECDCRLLFVALGYCFVIAGDDEPRG